MVLSSVKNLLSNRLYTGDFVWGRITQAKFYSMRAGDVSTEFETGTTTEENQVIITDNHTAIIDRDLFEQIQSTFGERKRQTTPLANGGDFVLSGLLRCADCGYGMVGTRDNQRIFYRCGGSQAKGVEFCHPHNVYQDEILKSVFETLDERFGQR